MAFVDKVSHLAQIFIKSVGDMPPCSFPIFLRSPTSAFADLHVKEPLNARGRLRVILYFRDALLSTQQCRDGRRRPGKLS